jgi:hypothetical protein
MYGVHTDILPQICTNNMLIKKSTIPYIFFKIKIGNSAVQYEEYEYGHTQVSNKFT